jgi:D-alanyl-lipoteichoic acid acyltransferase DltB (MBOAT superfamily)
MLFNSPEFAAFFPVVTLLYFALPHRLRWLLLLMASCVFYMAFLPKYLLILFGLIAVDYAAGLWIEGAKGWRRQAILVASLAANLGILALFKYWPFFDENLVALSQAIGWNYSSHALALLLPIGLSFHTFQSMAYTIEVYRGRQAAERHLGIYALYVLFYPQLVAGPIERPQHLLHQFREEHRFDCDRVVGGLRLMLGGFLKKMLIADRLAVVVNRVYQDPHSHQGPALLLASVFFAFQIYCDFSGYTDIARGAARVMGFRLIANFNHPYSARSIADFWRRWHISLSTWFRDYLYIPLGGNRVSPLRRSLNLMIVFVVSGFWHGASWAFLAWGALHGLYLIVGSGAGAFRESYHRLGATAAGRAMQVLFTFTLVTVAWVFFRASTVADAAYVLSHLGTGWWFPGESLLGVGVSARELAIDGAVILALEAAHRLQARRPWGERIQALRPWARWAVYYGCFLAIAALGQFKPQQFIYFQF